MARQALFQTLRRAAIFDLPHHERVIANQFLAREGNIGLRSTRLLILQGIAGQKTVEGIAAAVEVVHCMAAVQLFDLELVHSVLPRSKTVRLFRSRASRAAGRGGAASAA